MSEMVRVTAARQWVSMSDDQKAVVRFGMIPIEVHREAYLLLGDIPDFHRLHAVALMTCAKHDGGMRA